MCVTWLTSNMWAFSKSFVCVMWLMCMCYITCSCVWHDSLAICGHSAVYLTDFDCGVDQFIREQFARNCSLFGKFHLLIREATNKISTKNRKSKSVYWYALGPREGIECVYERESESKRERTVHATCHIQMSPAYMCDMTWRERESAHCARARARAVKCTYLSLYVRMFVYMHVCMYVCMFVHIYSNDTCIYIWYICNCRHGKQTCANSVVGRRGAGAHNGHDAGLCVCLCHSRLRRLSQFVPAP